MVTAVIVSVTKPARPVETVHEDEELKDDFDIEIGNQTIRSKTYFIEE